MFKFKIVEGENQAGGCPHMESIFKQIDYLKEKKGNIKNPDITGLIITDARDQSIIGGTALVKRDLNQLQEEIRRLVPTGTFCRDYVWECSTISLLLSQNLNSDSSTPLEHFSRNFYRILYDGLVEFGEKKGVGFVIVKLTAEAYHPTKNFGLWPYIIQFLPREFPDDHFYGILPLRGYFCETYQKNWEAFEGGLTCN